MVKNNSISWFVKLLLLGSMAFMLLFAVAMGVMMAYGMNYNQGTAQVITIVLQNVLVFIVPVILLALINRTTEQRSIASTLWMTKGPSLKSILLVVLVWIIALPAMNWLVEWNNGIHLPQALHDLEKLMRDMENEAQKVTTALISTSSWGEMLLMVLVVGVLTGMGEELFFRAGMLGTMHYGKVNRHVAVWIAAIVFSAIHLQFYGFVPRLLLGAWFGYVMLWSGEVWTPIIAHALNNGAVVVAGFLAGNKYISSNFLEELGVPKEGEMPWLAIASAVATVIVIALFMKKKKQITQLIMRKIILLAAAAVTFAASAQEVICHRGYWDAEGSAQNSIRSLVKADSIGAWGSEFDVWMTADGKLVVNHDETFGGVTIETAKWKQLKNMRLKNGELLPTLEAMLKCGKKLKTKLIVEMKPHTSKVQELDAARKIVKMVKKLGLQDRVEYITFSFVGMKALKNLAPKGTPVYYLNGELSPKQLAPLGVAGIDYNIGTMRDNPAWINEAHELGMKVNVWTVNSERDMDWCINYGVDYITTNAPELLQQKLRDK